MNYSSRIRLSKVMAILLVFAMFFSIMPMQTTFAAAFDPNENFKDIGLRFWEDEKPDIGFYINAGNRYQLETVTKPAFGVTSGEWSVMDLLRGMYMGGDYINYIPENYFEGYIERVEEHVIDKKGILHRSKITEWCRAMLTLTPLNYDVTNVAGEYDFIERFSSSFGFTWRQGINGPIWTLIAMNTAKYDFYEDETNEDVTTSGKIIDSILKDENTQADGTVGGWSLFGSIPDPDITGMALQGLAPYYLDQEMYEAAGATTTYSDFAKAVERGVLTLSRIQKPNGGYDGWGSINSESIVWAIVPLTSLDIDPLSDNVDLPHIGESCSFITEGAVVDGVWTNNMIDALLTFWAHGSGSSPEVGGFKHVTHGSDGGGGSGHSVNSMATDQAIYGLIAYDRWVKGENKLYDMTDMMNNEYKEMKAKEFTLTYDKNDGTEPTTVKKGLYSTEEIVQGEDIAGKTFAGWNSEPDGSGTAYAPEELLIVPEQDITLYAQYEAEEYAITLHTNEGVIEGIEFPATYTVDDEIKLPDENQINRPGYTFKGWYDNENFDGSPVTAIEKGSTGDKEFYAEWEEQGPSINTSLVEDSQGIVKVSGENLGFDVWAEEFGGGKIDSSNIGVTVNDQVYEAVSEEEGKASYEVDLNRGENILVITATDAKGLVTTLEYMVISTSEEDQMAVNAVIGLIDKLPENITLADKEAVLAAKAAYDGLEGDYLRLLITNYNKLEDAEKAIENLEEAQKVIDLIDALPEEITLEHEEQVKAARQAYVELSDDQQALVSNEEKLKAAEKVITSLHEDQEAVQEVIDKIANLPDEITLDDKEDVELARSAYESLSEELQEKVDNIDKLIQAEKTIEVLKEEKEEEERKAKEKEEADKAKAKTVADMIYNLPDNLRLSDKAHVAAARAAYEELTEDQKAYVPNLDELQMAEKRIEQLEKDQDAANKVMDIIDGLSNSITLEDKAAVQEARKAYNDLSTDQQHLVSNIGKLIAAEDTIAKLEKEQDDPKDPDPKDPDPKDPDPRDPKNGKDPKDGDRKPGVDRKPGGDNQGKPGAKGPVRGGAKTSSAKTGDTTPLVPLTILLVAAFGGVLYINRRKARKTK